VHHRTRRLTSIVTSSGVRSIRRTGPERFPSGKPLTKEIESNE
jgi:hypothetical protein